MKKILDKIKEYNTIIIHGHRRPDGDCIGSQYGLMYLIKESFPEKNVYVTGEKSDYVSFIGTPYLIEENIFEHALSICLDCANNEKLSDQRYNKSKYSIKIDHHIKDKTYCDYEYINEHASSCAEIIIEFYHKFKNELKMNEKCATALYTGLITDTGHFKYERVSSKTFKLASILLENGANHSFINNNLSCESIELLKLKGYCLENFKITNNGFAYITLTKDVINSYKVSNEDAASLVNIISEIKDVPVWAIILDAENEIRVRLRSKGPDVNELAKHYNGGGHNKASGARLETWDDLNKLVCEADEMVKIYKESLHK